MSYESTAEPIKVGYLMDFTLAARVSRGDVGRLHPDLRPRLRRGACEQGLMDRPVQMIYREVEGLPKGSVKAVIDAYGELVDEGCLVVFGPNITDNCVPTARSDRGTVQGSGDQRHRHRRLAGRVDVRLPAGIDDRRADLPGRPHRQTRPARDRRPGRAESDRRELPEEPAKCVSPQGHSHRRGGGDRPDGAGHQRSGAARCTKPRPRRSCTWASVSASCSSTRRSRRSTGTRRASPPPPSRTRGSTRSCGTRSWAGSGSTSTTRRNPIGQDFLDRYAQRSTTAVVPNTACRW